MRREHTFRMVMGLVIGLVLGVLAHVLFAGSRGLDWVIGTITEPIGRVFLRLLFVLVIPLILSALALGVAGLGDLRQLGRIGLKMLAYTVVVSSIAVLIGVALVNLVRPGAGLSPEIRQQLTAHAPAAPPAAPAAGTTGVDFLVALVPSNIVKTMADGDMLALMVFSLLLGIGLALTRTDAARRFEDGLQGLYDVVMTLLGLVLRMAPLGVACLLFSLTARLGYDIIRQLGAYVFVVLLALAIQQFVVYSISVAWLGGMSPLRFFRDVREAMLTAFSTASSNATLPTSLRVAEERLGLPPRQPLRADPRLDREPERHGIVRGRDRAVPRPVLRHRPDDQPAAHGRVHLHPGRHRHGRRAGGIDPGRCDDPRHRRRAGRGHRHHPRRRPLPRHVPDDAQRDGGSRGGGGGVAGRGGGVTESRAVSAVS